MLPLKLGTKIAVVGPQAIAREGLLEDYAADQQVARLRCTVFTPRRVLMPWWLIRL